MLEVTFGLPTVGWLPISINAGVWTVAFRASYVWPPWEDLIGWLEALADGGFPRMLIDIEPADIEFITGPGADSAVCLQVVDHRSHPPAVVGTTEARCSLIAAFYAPFIAFWESEAFAAAWAEWDISLYDYENGPEQPDRGDWSGSDSLSGFPVVEAPLLPPVPEDRLRPYPLRSAKLDALLAEMG